MNLTIALSSGEKITTDLAQWVVAIVAAMTDEERARLFRAIVGMGNGKPPPQRIILPSIASAEVIGTPGRTP